MTLSEGQIHQSQGSPKTEIYTCFCYKGKIFTILQHNSSARANGFGSAVTPVLSEHTWYTLLCTLLLTLPRKLHESHSYSSRSCTGFTTVKTFSSPQPTALTLLPQPPEVFLDYCLYSIYSL